MEEISEHLPLGVDHIAHWMTDDIRKMPDLETMLQDLLVQPMDDSKILPGLQWDNVFDQSPALSAIQTDMGPIMQTDAIGNLGDEFLIDPRNESAMNFLLNNFDNLENDLELSADVIIDPCDFIIQSHDAGFTNEGMTIQIFDSGLPENNVSQCSGTSKDSLSCESDKSSAEAVKKAVASVKKQTGLKETTRSSKLVSLLAEAPIQNANSMKKSDIRIYKKQSNEKVSTENSKSAIRDKIVEKSVKSSAATTTATVTINAKTKSKEKPVSGVNIKPKKCQKSSQSTSSISHPVKEVNVKSRSTSPTITSQNKPAPIFTESPLLMEAMMKQASLPVRKVSKPRRPSVQIKANGSSSSSSPSTSPTLTKVTSLSKEDCKKSVQKSVEQGRSSTKLSPEPEKSALTAATKKTFETSPNTESIYTVNNSKPIDVTSSNVAVVSQTKISPSLKDLYLNSQKNEVLEVMVAEADPKVPETSLQTEHVTANLTSQESLRTMNVFSHQKDSQFKPVRLIKQENKLVEVMAKSEPEVAKNYQKPIQQPCVSVANSTLQYVSTPPPVISSSPPAKLSPSKISASTISPTHPSTVTQPSPSPECSNPSSVSSRMYVNSPSVNSSLQLSDEDSNCSLNFGGMGIAAMDVGSLLEQFEEVSATLVEQSKRSDFQAPLLQSYEPADCPSPLNGRKLIIPKKSLHQKVVLAKYASPAISPVSTPSSSRPVSPPCEIIEKIKNAAKRKSAIMLPMSMPSKRSRGPPKSVAVASSPRVQRVIQNSDPLTAAESADKEQVSLDHDYCFNNANNQQPKCDQTLSNNDSNFTDQQPSLPSSTLTSRASTPLLQIVPCNIDEVVDIVGVADAPINPPLPEEEPIVTEVTCPQPPPPLPLRDEEIKEEKPDASVLKTLLRNLAQSADAESCKEHVQVSTVPISSVNEPKVRLDHIAEEFGEVELDRSARRYDRLAGERLDYKENNKKMGRRKNNSAANAVVNDRDIYFDKLPNYCTALSHDTKPTKKDILSEALAVNGGHNYDRDPSPVRDDAQNVFSKLPAYYSCFTNSTKYDHNKDHNRNNSLGDESDSSQCSPDQKKWPKSRSSRRSSRDSRSSRSTRHRSRSRSSSSSSGSRSRSRSPVGNRSQRDRRPRRRYKRSASDERKRLEKRRLEAEEKNKKIDERRVIYVGNIPSNYKSEDLRERFRYFGEIEEANVHFREHGDNYGFVTFTYACDAFAAIEKGNDVPGVMKFDLCFGGRRQFCKSDYADLDGNNEVEEELSTSYKRAGPVAGGGGSFDDLLKQALARTKKTS